MTALPPAWTEFMATVEGRESPETCVLVDGLPAILLKRVEQGAAPDLPMLAAFLRSGQEMPREIRDWLADMMDETATSESVFRLQIEKRSPGRPPAAIDRHWDAAEFYLKLLETKTQKAARLDTMAQFNMKPASFWEAISSYRKAIKDHAP